MNNLGRAKNLLHEGNYTLVLASDAETITSTERGVRPLLKLIDEGADVKGYSAADLVVGKAAAFLYVILGVKEVYANVMSQLAAEVLLRHGIAVDAGGSVERIINRTGDGPCPMESAVGQISAPDEALTAIRAKIAAMRKQ